LQILIVEEVGLQIPPTATAGIPPTTTAPPTGRRIANPDNKESGIANPTNGNGQIHLTSLPGVDWMNGSVDWICNPINYIMRICNPIKIKKI
jgi:hypothetical protein